MSISFTGASREALSASGSLVYQTGGAAQQLVLAGAGGAMRVLILRPGNCTRAPGHVVERTIVRTLAVITQMDFGHTDPFFILPYDDGRRPPVHAVRPLRLEGEHPEFGRVTLRQLLATWVTHDLSHVAHLARVMAKQYRDAVGPWRAYLPVLDR